MWRNAACSDVPASIDAAAAESRRNHCPANYGRAIAPIRRLNVQLKKTILNENTAVEGQTLRRCRLCYRMEFGM
jgi:hypothetical protein